MCPNCGSENVKGAVRSDDQVVYKCVDCGYSWTE
jgi:transposase-like protein